MMRPEVAATLLLWSVLLVVTLAILIVLLLVERVRDGRLRDRLIDAAGRDGKVIVARNEQITALKAERDGLKAQVRYQSAELLRLGAPYGDRKTRRADPPLSSPDPVWADIVRRLGKLDGGDPS